MGSRFGRGSHAADRAEEAAIEGQFPLPSDADQGLDDTEMQDKSREESGENDSPFRLSVILMSLYRRCPDLRKGEGE
jgi:hypothetical protein